MKNQKTIFKIKYSVCSFNLLKNIKGSFFILESDLAK